MNAGGSTNTVVDVEKEFGEGARLSLEPDCSSQIPVLDYYNFQNIFYCIK